MIGQGELGVFQQMNGRGCLCSYNDIIRLNHKQYMIISLTVNNSYKFARDFNQTVLYTCNEDWVFLTYKYQYTNKTLHIQL